MQRKRGAADFRLAMDVIASLMIIIARVVFFGLGISMTVPI